MLVSTPFFTANIFVSCASDDNSAPNEKRDQTRKKLFLIFPKYFLVFRFVNRAAAFLAAHSLPQGKTAAFFSV